MPGVGALKPRRLLGACTQGGRRRGQQVDRNAVRRAGSTGSDCNQGWLPDRACGRRKVVHGVSAVAVEPARREFIDAPGDCVLCSRMEGVELDWIASSAGLLQVCTDRDH